jgi:hypothetical protein
MTNQEIEIALRTVKRLQSGDMLARHVNELVFNIIKTTLEKQLTNSWIPVSERLPESNKTVFVYAKGICRNGTMHTVGACHNGFWFLPNSEDTFGFPFTRHKIIAWQPLPQPYKEDYDGETK